MRERIKGFIKIFTLAIKMRLPRSILIRVSNINS